MQHLNIKIFGRVQGVFFRLSAQYTAKKLSITGFVRNESDGTVYIEAEGKEENLQKFLTWCKKGPPWALVENIDFEYSTKLNNFPSFVIF